MDKAALERASALAEKHVAVGGLLERQSELIAKLESLGKDASGARDLFPSL
jgi:hypothetical protein